MSAMRPSRHWLTPERSPFMPHQQLQEERVLDPRAVALPIRLVRDRRPQLLVELGGGASERREHHQEIEMKGEVKQRRDDVERQQFDLDVEDGENLRLAEQQISMCGVASAAMRDKA